MMSSITGLYQCPDCSKPVSFRSNETNVIVCTCGSVLRRKEIADIDAIITEIIAFSDDFIQVGTTGKWKNKAFEVIGRYRFWLDESVYNYWTVVFSDGTHCYLGEGYGLYAFFEKALLDMTVDTDEIKRTTTGNDIELMRDEYYVLHSKDSVSKIEVEGELLLPELGSGIRTYDYSSYKGNHLQFIEWVPGLITAYKVEYLKADKLELKNVNTSPLKGKDIKCPGCKMDVHIKTFPYAQSGSCTKCGKRFSLRDKTRFDAVGKDKTNDNALNIPIGSVGELSGIKYEVIGYARKEELNEYNSRWKEYVLYSKKEGYAFLAEYNGHWIYLREQGDVPVLNRLPVNELEYERESFKLFNNYEYKTLDTAGEFPYDIFNDGTVKVYEFISPPEMWTAERNNKEGLIWFYGRHISLDHMLNQFPYALPSCSGVGVLEPGFVSPGKIFKVTFLAMLFLLLVHLIISAFQQNKVLLDTTYYMLPDTANTITSVTDKFKLTKWKSNLMFNISADVNNNWFELSANLVNAKTGEEFAIEQGVEYYSGYTDGESWAEGSKDETAYLSSVPAGTYFLQLQGSKPSGGVNSFSIKVTNDTIVNKNLYIFILLLLIWPVVQYIIVVNKEKRRWYNSPFSPYTYED